MKSCLHLKTKLDDVALLFLRSINRSLTSYYFTTKVTLTVTLRKRDTLRTTSTPFFSTLRAIKEIR